MATALGVRKVIQGVTATDQLTLWECPRAFNFAADDDVRQPKELTIVQPPSLLLEPLNSLRNVNARRAAQLTSADAAKQAEGTR